MMLSCLSPIAFVVANRSLPDPRLFGAGLEILFVGVAVGGLVICWRALRLRVEIASDHFVYHGILRTKTASYADVSGCRRYVQTYLSSRAASVFLLSRNGRTLAWLSQNVLAEWDEVEDWLAARFGLLN